MVRILDKFYTSPQYIYEKGALCTLKRVNSEHIEFVENTHQPTIMLLSVDAVSDVDEDTLNDIIKNYKLCTGNKVVIDTTIEDFINFNFFKICEKLLHHNIDPNDIVVLTSQTSAYHFRKDYKIPFKIIPINAFEYSFFHTEVVAQQLPIREIKPRSLEKHFSYFIKNARTTRKLFHAYMALKEYTDKSFYSFHNMVSPFTRTDEQMLERYDFINYQDSDSTKLQVLDRMARKHVIDDYTKVSEWQMPQYSVEKCGLHFTLETHAYMVNISERALEFDDRVFMTEKTYKPFFYGVPCLNPGIPSFKRKIEELGYYTFEKFFNTKIDGTDYETSFKSYFKLIDEMANMPLSQFEELLNTREVLDVCQHNQTHFMSQPETKRLINALSEILNN